MSTPIERLQAAIEKLKQQRKDTFGQGEHGWWVEEQQANPAFEAEVRAKGVPDGFHDGIAMVQDIADAELIVTLHRTIDAQLAILRHVATHYSGDLGIGTNRHVVALADAILGHVPAPELSERELAEVARFGIHPELTMAEDW